MSKSKESKNKKVDIDVSVDIVQDNQISNGEILSATSTRSDQFIEEFHGEVTIATGTVIDVDFNGESRVLEEGKTETKWVDREASVEKHTAEGLSMDDLHNIYIQNGNSGAKTYDALKTYITKNKDNPQAIKNTVSMLLGDMNKMYDQTKAHRKVGVNQEDVLDKMMSTDRGEEVDALICGTIHDFVAQTLNDCGFQAVLLTGGNTPDSSGAESHATLLYQLDNGKYIFNNYSNTVEISASNIKDAAREVYKRTGSLESGGMISLKDKDKYSAQWFAFEKEAAFGDEMDKTDYQSKTPIDRSIPQKSEIHGNSSISTIGNASAKIGGTLVHGNSNTDKVTSVDLQYKKSGESAMFLESNSVGIKAEHSQTNNSSGVYFDAKTVISNTNGKIFNETGYSDSEGLGTSRIIRDSDDLSYLSGMVRGAVGKETPIVQDNNISINNVSEVSVVANGTVGINQTAKGTGSADGRISFETGFASKMQLNNNTSVAAGFSGGMVLDATHTCDGFKFTEGAKLNFNGNLTYNPTKEVQIDAGMGASSVFTHSTQNLELNGGIGAAYKPEGSKVSLFASAKAGYEREKLNLAGFKEKTENNLTYSLTLGANINNKTQVYGGVTSHKDFLNNTRNYNQVEIGIKHTF